MVYIELNLGVSTDYVEVLLAELSQIGYESFVYTDSGANAYIPENLFRKEEINELQEKYSNLFSFEYCWQKILPQNWNEVWEASYEPIFIQETCVIKSDFHQIDKKYPYEIIINPKMSFGTGHHETTKMMIEHQLEIDHQAKSVLDVGCGTGVLSLMAELLGAHKIIAFDIDEWAVTNTLENILVNNSKRIQVSQNTIKSITLEDNFDIILANINRNVLLTEIPWYAKLLKTGALLVISGFYESDRDAILEIAKEAFLNLEKQKVDNQWTALVLKKNI